MRESLRLLLLVLLLVTQTAAHACLPTCAECRVDDDAPHPTQSNSSQTNNSSTETIDNEETYACARCVEGYYDRFCLRPCPQRCAGACERLSGACLACQSGFHGTECEERCPETCRGPCTSLPGNSSALQCTACVPGRTGIACDEECGRCGGDGSCDQETKVCVNSQCGNGTFGALCTAACSADCLSSACVDSPRNCRFGCAANRGGPECRWRCHACAAGACTQFGCERCQIGFWGDYCERSCSSNCANSDCDQVTGFCLAGCKAGWTSPVPPQMPQAQFRETCAKRCHESCVRLDFEDSDDLEPPPGRCNATHCLDQCAFGHTGPDCSYFCTGPSMQHRGANRAICENSPTDRCDIDGCTRCSTGYYGKYCNMRCIHCAGDCEQETGRCSECRDDNRYGSYCDRVFDGCKVKLEQDGTCNECGDLFFRNSTWSRLNQNVEPVLHCRPCPLNCSESVENVEFPRICEEGTGICLHGCKNSGRLKGDFCDIEWDRGRRIAILSGLIPVYMIGLACIIVCIVLACSKFGCCEEE